MLNATEYNFAELVGRLHGGGNATVAAHARVDALNAAVAEWTHQLLTVLALVRDAIVGMFVLPALLLAVEMCIFTPELQHFCFPGA